MASKNQDKKKAQKDNSYTELIERARNFVNKGSTEITVDLEEHKKEVEEYIMRPLQIKQSTYKKLVAMVKKYNKKKALDEKVNEIEFLERIINAFHKNIFENNTRKCQK